jgi:hypothetical protein
LFFAAAQLTFFDGIIVKEDRREKTNVPENDTERR